MGRFLHDIFHFVINLTFKDLILLVFGIFFGLVIVIGLLYVLKEKIIKKGRKYQLSDVEKRKVKNLRVHPSQSHGLYASSNKRREKILTRMIVRFEGSYSSFGRKKEGGDMTIGKYGERAFGRSYPSAQAEALVSSQNFKGFIDFKTPNRIYEIKTTDYRGVISPKWENKWMYQLACYVYLTQTPGTLKVYQHLGNGNVNNKYAKHINTNDKIIERVKNFDGYMSAWKRETMEKGYIIYKPKSMWEGLKLWFGGEIKVHKPKGRR